MNTGRFIRSLAAALLVILMTAALPLASSAQITASSPAAIDKGKTLNVLFIGNSFSEDTTRYMYDIVRQTGYKICVGDAWIGGSKLSDHANYAKSDAKKYTYIENSSGSWSARKYNGSRTWKLSWVMSRKKWDVIILQSLSTDVGRLSSFFPGGDESRTSYLEELARYCRKKRPNARIGYNMTWALPSSSDAEGFAPYKGQMGMMKAAWKVTRDLLDDVNEENEADSLPGSKEVFENMSGSGNLIVSSRTSRAPLVEFVIPTGTAVQNARTSYMRDTLNRDNKHLSNDIGRCIASMTAAASLGYPVDRVSKLNLSSPTSLLHLPVLVSSAKDAVKNPFALTEEEEDRPVLDDMTIRVTNKKRVVTVQWEEVDGATSYVVEYMVPGSKSYKTVTVSASKTSCQFTGKKGTNLIRAYAKGDSYIRRTKAVEDFIELP